MLFVQFLWLIRDLNFDFNFLSSGFICGYKVIAQKRRRIPFIVELKDRSTGAAIIRLAEGKKLQYKKRQTYKFSLIAYDCGGIRRESNRYIHTLHLDVSSEIVVLEI